MSREAVILNFPGVPAHIAKAYAEGIRQFSQAHPDVRPEMCFTGHGKADALFVVLMWPEGTSHEVLGKFLVERLGALGLPRPQHVDHLYIDAAGWDAIAAVR